MEDFNFNDILDQSEIDNLFGDDEGQEGVESNDSLDNTTGDNSKNKSPDIKENTVENDVNPEDLFDSESVDSVIEKDNKELGGEPSYKGNNNSPKSNFYSSIVNALKEDGILTNLDENIKVENAEDFADVFEKFIQSKLDEKQQRIDSALNYGIEPSEVNNFEKTIAYLDSITEDALSSEDSSGEELRKNLIYNDYINRGFSKERATKEIQRSIDAGTDIEDAKEALASNKDFYKKKYESVIQSAKEQKEIADKQRKEDAENLKKSILDADSFLGNLVIDKSIKQKAYDSITKPVYKDPETGEYLTEVQKYAKENNRDFWKNLGVLYAVTDGFKNIDKVIKTNVKKEVRKSIRNLEHTLNNSALQSDGSLNYMSGVSSDKESYLGNGIMLDV